MYELRNLTAQIDGAADGAAQRAGQAAARDGRAIGGVRAVATASRRDSLARRRRSRGAADAMTQAADAASPTLRVLCRSLDQLRDG